MAEYLQSDVYDLPFEHVKLGRYTIEAADAIVADTDGILAVANPKGPCLVTLVASTAVTDILTVAFPCTQTNAAELAGLTVTLDANSGNTLDVSASEATGNILIKLANATAANNTAALIQAAIQNVTPSGDGGVKSVLKGVSLAAITCVAGGDWDTKAVAEGSNMTDVAFEGGAGETKTTFLSQPTVPRNITATTANGDAAGDIGAVSVIVYGTNINDQVISETLPAFSANAAATKAGSKAFKTITSIFLPSHDGTGCTLSVGFGDVLGLPMKFSKQPLCWVTMAGALKNAPTIAYDEDELEKNTLDPADALDSSELCIYLGIPEA
jgi:hypothetical protein